MSRDQLSPSIAAKRVRKPVKPRSVNVNKVVPIKKPAKKAVKKPVKLPAKPAAEKLPNRHGGVEPQASRTR